MSTEWGDVRRAAMARGTLDTGRLAEARRQAEDAVHAYRLSEVRRSRHVSQTTLAATMNVSQARVSKLENGDIAHSELGTISAYVEALGGTLRIVADFGDRQVVVA